MKKRILLFVTMLFLGSYAFAQEPGDFGNGDDPDPLDEPAAPIDIYINVLLLSAVGLAFYGISPGKIRPARKKSEFDRS